MSGPEDLRWYLLQNKIHESRIREAFQLFRDHGIEPILIKGWAIARLYPEERPRRYTDIDLGVAGIDYARSLEILNEESSKKLNVDLHNEFRHLDTVSWDDLFNDSKIILLEGFPVRVLSAEDHLRLLCVHWLTDGGEDKEKLYDIHYAVQNRSSNFDWPKALDRAGEIRRSWLIATIGLAHKYTGLSLEGVPFAHEARNLPRWLTQRVEKEWKIDTPLRPMHDSFHSWKSIFKQLRKRLPPNPLSATVQCDAPIDHGPRLVYQVRSFFKRALPGISRIIKTRKVASGKNAKR